MFNKLKEFCTFKKKENLMATTTSTTDTRTTKQLKKQITQQGESIGRLRGRVSQLQDEVEMIKNEMNVFKQRVAADIGKVVNTISEK
jgi:archaellum component FlaC